MKQLSHSGNNFDVLRIIAALLVFYSHSFAFFGLHEPILIEPTYPHKEIAFGTFGVSIFFAISGFLITSSFMNSPDFKAFFAKRFARLYPGYWGNMIFMALILGPVVSSLGFMEYFTQLQPLKGQIFMAMLGVFRFFIPHLPGVFTNNVRPFEVNASLWTISFEMFCYAVIGLLGVAKLLKKEAIILCILIALLLLNQFLMPLNVLALGKMHVASFFAGALIFMFSDRLKFKPVYFYMAFAGIIAFSVFNIYFIPGYILLVTYAVICFALMNNKFAFVSKHGDFSYGIYLYSCPIQQAFAQYYQFDKAMFVYYFISSLITVIILAVLSWKLIEHPALRKIKASKVVKG